MGIKFRCHGCDKKLHVKAFLAGKRGVCPHCGAKVRIPEVDEQGAQSDGKVAKSSHTSKPSTSATAAASNHTDSRHAPTPTAARSSTRSALKQRKSPSSVATDAPDAILEAPEAVWYVRPPSGGQYGPADADIMRRWLEEGRVSADSLVWREGWDDWRTGDAVFPSLRSPTQSIAAPIAAEPVSGLPREELVLSETPRNARHPKSRTTGRTTGRTSARGVAVVVILSIVCLGLLITLLLVLQNQG